MLSTRLLCIIESSLGWMAPESSSGTNPFCRQVHHPPHQVTLIRGIHCFSGHPGPVPHHLSKSKRKINLIFYLILWSKLNFIQLSTQISAVFVTAQGNLAAIPQQRIQEASVIFAFSQEKFLTPTGEPHHQKLPSLQPNPENTQQITVQQVTP